MIPDVLASEDLKCARQLMRRYASEIRDLTGCNVVSFAAEVDSDLRSASTMAVDPELEDNRDKEVAVLRGVMTRAMSLLIMHLGKEQALSAALAAASYGAELLEQAETRFDA